MNTIAILTNLQKDVDLSVTENLTEILRQNGFSTVNISSPAQIGANMDILIVLGGDGTLLTACEQAAPKNIPLLGINLGRLGFLNEWEPDALLQLGVLLAQNKYTIEKRMMLSARIDEGPAEYALNDFVFARGGYSRGIHIEVTINGLFVDAYMADGVIISSPTGSTAYALSAGGPIISPELNCMLITPISAHTLHARPLVISDKDTVCLRASLPEETALLTPDGRDGQIVTQCKTVCISRAPFDASFIRFEPLNFYNLLHKKLREWNAS